MLSANISRFLPIFKGKQRLASLLLASELYKDLPRNFTGKNNIIYHIPNTIDAIGRELFINGVFEEGTIRLIRNLLSPDKVFFDIGANIGAISVPVAKDKNVVLHAFEPNFEVFGYLQKNILTNSISAHLNNYAVYSSDGKSLQFYPVKEQFGQSALSPTYENQPHYRVHTISLDGYCERNNIPHIDVLKIDVQGFETEVIKGCMKLLSQKKIANIIFEFEEWANNTNQSENGSAQGLLRSFGYSIFSMDGEEINKNITKGSYMLWAKISSI